VTWGPCNDTVNGDFDFGSNCGYQNGRYCFAQSSYDCYDPDCDMLSGTTAWNNYTYEWTTGLCAYYNESQTAAMCFDGYNNDWATEDARWGHANRNLNFIDCRDSDCDLISNGSVECNFDIELNCSDNFDNDMYNLKDCELTQGGYYNHSEYDCAGYCRATTGNNTETAAQCDDDWDNDYDRWKTTTGRGWGYDLNDTFGAGMDCAYGTNADEDCNGTVMSSGFTCELTTELTCDDEFDNDYDYQICSISVNGTTGEVYETCTSTSEPEPGWTQAAYNAYFNTTHNIEYSANADFDDYDCQNHAWSHNQ